MKSVMITFESKPINKNYSLKVNFFIMYNQFKSLFLVAVLFSFFAIGCQKEDNVSDVENYTNGVVDELQERAACGMARCYELVFPLSIVFPDNTTAVIDSMGAMKAAVRAWRTANPDVKGKTEFVFPITVIEEDGTIITVDDNAGLREIAKECRREIKGGGHGRGEHCFKIQFPFSVQKADGTIVVIESASDLPKPGQHMGGMPTADVRPALVFPITVTLKDGTSQVVNSKEELIALKDSCK